MISKAENLDCILENWMSPFTGLSLMNNWQTPVHCDNGGCYCGMDLLATVGPYQRGRMNLPGLGLKLEYNSGTLVGVTGRILQHGAAASGERVCFALKCTLQD